MPLIAKPVADQIAAFIKANAPAPGAPVTDSQLQSLWEGIIGLLYTDIKASALVTINGAVTSGVGAGGTVIGTGTVT